MGSLVGAAGLAAVLAAVLGCPSDEPGAGDRPAAPARRMEAPAPAEPAPIRRIVSLSPLATRFLVALGAGDRIVAVDAESRRLPGVADRPPATFGEARHFEPDLVLVPALPDDAPALVSLRSDRTRVLEFAPHDLEDVFALCRSLGAELVGKEAAERFEGAIARPLALVAGESPAEGRPRVLALVAVDPPEIAGGHSFETDLIEIAGGSSLTHGGADHRLPVDAGGLARFAPDLVLVMTPRPLGPAEEDRALRFVADVAPVELFPFDREDFWLGEPAAHARRLRTLVLALERARAAPTRP